MGDDGVVQIEGTSPCHAEAGASVESGCLTCGPVLLIETASVFVADLWLSAVVTAACIVIGCLRTDPACSGLPIPVRRSRFLLLRGHQCLPPRACCLLADAPRPPDRPCWRCAPAP
jgi:hypothetical protein